MMKSISRCKSQASNNRWRVSIGDWIALGSFGLTGCTMFFTLLGVIWRWASSIEKRLTSIEVALGLEREREQVAQSTARVIKIGGG